MPRILCPDCERPLPSCYCRYVTPARTRTKVLILQHPRESRVAINTARIARLCLPNAEIKVGIAWEHQGEVAALLADPEREPILLYPGEGAGDIAERRGGKPVTLVVIDGTWSQSRAVLRSSPLLAKLPRYAFVPRQESEYRIRREPRREFVSTLESLVHVLGVLEDDGAGLGDALMAPFRAMVDFQLTCVKNYHVPRARVRPKRVARRPVLPRVLVERKADLLCVVGEANAWPRQPGEPHRVELVHWVAYRLLSGERFECVLAPRDALAPSTSGHLSIPREALTGGSDLRAFADAWRSFVRNTDVVCSWGYFAINLLRQAGGMLPGEHLDLRSIAKQWSRRRWGSVDQFQQHIQEHAKQGCAILGQGRAGVNLGRVVCVTRFLVERAVEETP